MRRRLGPPHVSGSSADPCWAYLNENESPRLVCATVQALHDSSDIPFLQPAQERSRLQTIAASSLSGSLSKARPMASSSWASSKLAIPRARRKHLLASLRNTSHRP